MASTITIRINDKEQTVASKLVTSGQGKTAPLVLQVAQGHNLQLIDQSTGHGPRRLLTHRVGNDLLISLEGGEIGAPDVVVQNYYGACDAYLLGQAADGKFYTYSAESGQSQLAVAALADTQMAAQSLGSAASQGSPWWTQAGCAVGGPAQAASGLSTGDMALYGGLGVLGVGAALAGRGHSQPAVPAPTVQVSSDGAKLIGTAAAGSTVQLDINGDGVTDITVVADATGHYVVDAPVPLVDGRTVSARAVNSAGATSPSATAVAPDFPMQVSLSADGSQALVTFATPGSTVTITNAAGVVLGSAVVGADGSVPVLLATPQLNGELVGASTPTEQSQAQAVDRTPPALTGALSLGSNSGATGDNLTNDNTPEISGQSEPGARISVAIGGQTLTTVAGADGSWSVTPTALADGNHNAVVTATDAAGNASSQTLPLTVDTVAPALAGGLAAGSDSGSAGDALTQDNTPTLKGTGEPGATITVVIGGQTLSTTVAADGSWSVTPTALADGSYTATVTSTDPAGNTSSVDLPVIVDTTTALSAALALGSDAGVVGDSLTNNPMPTLSGSGEPGARISVTVGGQVLSTTVAPDGSWSVTPSLALTDGTYDVVVSSTDAAGNSASQTVPITVDTSAPALAAALPAGSDTGLVGDALTNDSTPTLSGTGEPGARISVAIGGQTLATTVAPDGSWSVTPAALVDGETSAVVTQTDAAGNSSTASVPLTIDTTAPALSGALAGGSDSGVAGDSLTSNPTPTLSGTGEPGARISVVIGEGAAAQTLTTTVAADGAWSVTPTALADGSYSAAVTATDAAGNSVTAHVPVTVDTRAPALSAVVAAASDSGVAGDSVTRDNTPTLSGTGEPGARIGVVIGTGADLQTLTTTVAADGTWSVTPSTLADGAYTATVTALDAAGNASTASVPLTVDTSAPALTAVLDPASDSGAPGDGLTRDDTPTVSGTGEPGAAISVAIGGQTLTTTVAADGSWSVTPSTLAAGPYTAAVTLTDAAGNSSAASVSLTVDPNAPALSARLAPASDSGVAGDSTTSDTTPTISGTGEVGAAISVVIDGQTLTTTVAADGTWSVTASALADGPHTASVTSLDLAGNTATASVTLVVDTNAPALTAALAAASDSGLAADNLTNDATPTITGTGEPGASISVVIDGQTLTTTVAADGTWSVTPTTLADGDHTATVTATDAAGNSSTASVSVTVDTGAPALTAVVDAASDSGVAGDHNTSDPTPTISGTGEAGASISVVIDGQTLTTTVAADGTWSVTPTTLADGAYTAAVTQTDPAGNTSTASVPVTVDTSAPALTAVLDAASDTGTAADALTNDPTPTISGTGEPGASISVVIGVGADLQTLTTTVAADGTWRVTPAALADGAYTAAVTQTDPAGNSSTASVPVTVDTSAPALTAVLDAASDSGVAADALTNDNTPTISGTGEAGANISVLLGGQTLTTTVAADGTWSVTPTTLADGAYTAAVTQTDPAGNSSTASVPVTVDTSAPALTAVLDTASDTGVAGDALTNDPTPTISGTGEAGASISVVIDGQTLTTTVAADGTWSVTPAALADGAYTAVVTQTDVAGTSSTASVPVTVDTSAPALTAVLDAASDSGVAADALTNDPTPTISGTGEPGARISVVIGVGADLQTLTTTVATDGTWSVTLTTLADGAYTAAVTQTDPAGNTSTASVPVTVDTGAPALTAMLDAA